MKKKREKLISKPQDKLNHKKYILLLIIGSSFLNFAYHAEIKPVQADITNINVIASQDTWINSYYPTSTYGSDSILQSGYRTSGGWRMHTLLYFDISGCNGIASATLNIYVYDVWNLAIPHKIHIVSSSWTESTSWNTQPSYISTVNITTGSLGIGSHSIDITPIAQDWEDGDLINYGLRLENDAESHYADILSSEAGANEPSLDLTCYNPPTVTHPADIIYHEGNPGQTIQWIGTDDNPNTYTITRNGTGVDSGSWLSGELFEVNITGFSIGTYVYEITLTDLDSYSVSDIVIVTVIRGNITIIGDADFAAQAISEGWPGDGTAGNPYIIQNYIYDGGGSIPGFSIINTTVHFILQDNIVQSYTEGFHLKNVTNGQLIRNSAIDNTGVGFKIEDSWFIEFIDNVAFSNDATGIEVYLSQYCDMRGNNITQNSAHGLYIENSIGTNIELNNVSLNGQNGIYINSFADPSVYKDNEVISNNVFNNANIGIATLQTQNNLITKNKVQDNLFNIRLNQCENCTISENTLVGAGWSIFLTNSNGTLITLNHVSDASSYGIAMDINSLFNRIYRNGLYNNNGQGYDDGFNNTWYDINTNEGNLYDTYNGSGPFTIQGAAGNIDPYPQLFIIINGPTDFSITHGAIGYSLIWQISIEFPGNFPANYTVFRNNTVIQFGSVLDGNWSLPVFLALNGLDPGLYNYSILVFNDIGKYETDTVWITVIPDLIPPSIDSPPDITFEEGSIGYSITWTTDDANPWQAVVLLDDIEIYNQYDLDALMLTAAVYNFTCMLYDKSGNFINDTVFVNVTTPVPDMILPTVTPPANVVYVVGTTGHFLTFNANDDHPKAYIWFLNGTEMGYEPWYGGVFNLSIDELAIGLWIINVTLYDLSGNNITVSVMVEVIPIPPDYTAPDVSSPVPMVVHENTPESIIWEVGDDYPANYLIFRNGSLVEQGYWITGIIQYSLAILPVGVWEINLTIYDTSGNFNSNTVIITVNSGAEMEFIPPVISTMPDIEIVFNSTGNKVIFKIFDNNPKLVILFLNDLQVYSLPWNEPNQKIEFSLDALAVGRYNITLIAYDIFDNSAFESLTITVTGDDTPPTMSSPDSINVKVGQQVVVSWSVSDANLERYELIMVETGDVIETGTFDGITDTVSTTILEQSTGKYTLRLIVYDSYGHKTMDYVTVVIGPVELTSGEDSPGFETISLLSIFCLGIAFRFKTYYKKQNTSRRNI
ncbi:MAG: DNRLRE domain-containing protein [Candidatus Kariarchaeaceae archaeon]